MNASLVIRRALKWTAAALAVLIVMAALLAAALDTGYFHGPLIRYVAACAGRQIQVGGLETHFFSSNPRVIATRVVISNPPWIRSGIAAQIGKMSLLIQMPRFGRPFGIARLETQAATLHLVRDATAHANWQWTDPDQGPVTELPLIRSLSMLNAQVDLDDALRHLQFEGAVSAYDVKETGKLPPLRIEGAGQLNGRAATFEITADPLAGARHESSYGFSFTERSSGSRLIGRGMLLRAFDFGSLDATFEATGADLKDLYFLTGVTLANTGSYRLSGKLARRGTNSKFSDLLTTFGQSDIQGQVSIESSSGRPKLDADLNSQFLRLSDLGARAAGRDSEAGTPLLLSTATLSPSLVRRGEAIVNFHARRVDVGRVPLQAVSARMTIDHGILSVAPLSANVLEGQLTAQLKVDATTDIPAADLDLKISNLQLGKFDYSAKGQPPLEGLLQARVIVTGKGNSIHQVAAGANGTVTAVLPHGAMRASLAELTGIDLRGLGLLLTKNKEEIAVRCGVASFQAHAGTLTAQTVVLDTDPVLITGAGQVHLDSEAVDLMLRGHPKSVRLLRLRSPLLVRGTLSHPSIDIQAHNSLAQTAGAVALGVLLTPLAAVLAFVDPGLAKDTDCAALLAAAKNQESSAQAAPVTR
jgi:uncharacterized protein involved in outer membrane biogenesis